jgi:hypothetical protein
MIRGAIVHLLNEQPILVDLLAMPAASDTGLVCTNLRTLDGRKPIFIEHQGSTFFFPYLHIRFIEVPGETEGGVVPAPSPAAASAPSPAEEEDLEIDEDFLRRIRDA